MKDRLGPVAVRYARVYLWRRYRRQVWLGLGVASILAAVAGGYAATRDVPEG
jgi:hypothetical protein